MQLQQPQPRIRIHALHPRHIKNSSASGRDTPLSGLALDVYGQVLAVVYEAADRYPADRTSQLVDLTWVYAPPRMCQYPAGTVNPQQHTYQGRTGRGSSGNRAAQVAPLLPGTHPDLRARCLIPGPSGVLQPAADALSALTGDRHVSSDYV